MYGHVAPKLQQQAADQMDAVIGATKKAQKERDAKAAAEAARGAATGAASAPAETSPETIDQTYVFETLILASGFLVRPA